jgi:hypothetical protein
LNIDTRRHFKKPDYPDHGSEGKSILYSYNANDDLASFADQEGNVTKYGYDSDHT